MSAGLVVDAHLMRCPGCRDSVALLTDTAGAVLSGLPDARLQPQALPSALERLDASPPAAVEPPSPAIHEVELPPLADAFGFRRWRWVAPGIRLAESHAPSEEGWKTFLLKVAPGRSLPTHGHDGGELVCVLQGGFTDGERWFSKGDFAEAEGADTHRLTAARDEVCICIVSTQAPLKWCGWTRWLQPFIGV